MAGRLIRGGLDFSRIVPRQPDLIFDLRGSVKMRQEKILSCYAVKRKDCWEAICLDFDIAVQGVSFAEVTDKLHDALHSYVEYINTLPEEDQQRFLTRQVPWYVRFKFVLGVALTMAFHGPNHIGHQSFGLPCTV